MKIWRVGEHGWKYEDELGSVLTSKVGSNLLDRKEKLSLVWGFVQL